MKNIFIIIMLLLITLKVMGQITLLHDYDSASTYPSGSPLYSSQLMLINFAVSGERYVKINRGTRSIEIYDMNYNLVKTINCSNFPTSVAYSHIMGNVLYLSENLFSTDSKIAFMYGYYGGPVDTYTGIYEEDGTLLFSDTCSPLIYSNTPLQQFPIYNTPNGTIMILSYPSGHAKVFSLPGTLSNAIQEANGQLIQAQNGQFSNLYPNPSNGAVTLQYVLPKGEQQGELVLYNMLGAEVKRYKVDNTFKDVLLDNTRLPAGTYFYQLQTSKGSVGTKKMVVIK